ncbi:AATF isoform X2 [Olea europaea subsp. europaea]|uniref:AATF isoform X2 n=1 Tax=Olea europaea subsp. europaea TaxID=158383 RepID=A0A8S0UA01_OLEEU|nr:AATF isoform X2 [Olea europaea subsp. europaea]
MEDDKDDYSDDYDNKEKDEYNNDGNDDHGNHHEDTDVENDNDDEHKGAEIDSFLCYEKIANKEVNKIVDQRASKSRKIRYQVHEKIVNFMNPEICFSGIAAVKPCSMGKMCSLMASSGFRCFFEWQWPMDMASVTSTMRRIQ